MINLVDNTLNSSDYEQIVKWIESKPDRFTQHKYVKEFEKQFSSYLGVKHSIFVNSGSSAILAVLAVLKQKGVKRIVIPNLCWATDYSTAKLLDFDVVMVDCNIDDLSLDLDQLEYACKQYKAEAVLLVSVLGLVPNMFEISKICENYNATLIEDVAESLGSEFKGTKLGNFGELSIFSTYFGHHVSSIEGGFVCTNNDELANLTKMVKSHGWARELDPKLESKLRKENEVDEFTSLYSFYKYGLNIRNTEFNAFVGLLNLKKLEEFVNKREKNFQTYKKNIKNNRLSLKTRSEDLISNFAYPILSLNKDKLIKDLLTISEVRPLIAGDITLHPFFDRRDRVIGNEISCEIHKNGFYIPNHPGITEVDILKLTEILNK
ncbi:DegT/DnrJ/EryC1/StrS aminotransferase family protein [bacterium]|nr:DegT/DnrJ/EryC1/StrS aminotransferase family protein [bacterium]MDA7660299.1 DegT/DnrJ/EryC1/StrS aminotransferase family protein [Verrucomicrobiota bacterium]